MDPNVLRTGLSVKIKRSDGRVHGAAVSGIDTDRRIVSVEWFEGGETKGKELDFEAVYSLNKELFQQKSVPLLKQSSASDVTSTGYRIPTAPVNARSRLPVSSVQRSNYERRTNVTPRENNVPRAGYPKAVENNRNSSQSSKPVSAVPARAKERAGGGRQLEREQQQLREKERGSDAVRESAPPNAREKQLAALKPPRKSNCVKEVERLKKNREERRAKQVALREEYCDHSLPNWEFLQKIGEFLSRLEMRPLQGDEEVYCKRISVCIRKRPLNKKEVNRKEIDVITVPDKSSVLVHEPKTKVDLTKYLDNQNFCFDYSFDENVDNEVVYRFTAQPLVHTIFERGMATCFAYGQTGSGKTHTMGGVFSGKEQDATRGIYALAAADVFSLSALPENAKKDLTISASFFEIYSGKVYDLLNKKVRLRILEDAKQQVQIVGLAEERVQNVQDVLHLIHKGNICRTSGTTSANQHSSRSHAIFQIILRKRMSGRLFGKFSLIDLAGNERGADTASADRQTRLEGAEINKSLLALKECIRALGRKGAHLPFRGSKLTLVLKDSFVGDNSRTCMIAMISPGFNSCEHTLNTLRYADRVKELSSNKGGGVGGVVFSAPPPLNHDPGPSDSSSHSPSYDEDRESEELASPPVVPGSPLHADLEYLHRSLQKEKGGELDFDNSSELLTFHEAISNLVESEEQLIEEHKSIIQTDQFLLKEEQALLEYVDDVDHDIEEYVKRMERIVSEKVDRLSKFKERIRDLRIRLEEEETASKNIKRLPML